MKRTSPKKYLLIAICLLPVNAYAQQYLSANPNPGVVARQQQLNNFTQQIQQQQQFQQQLEQQQEQTEIMQQQLELQQRKYNQLQNNNSGLGY